MITDINEMLNYINVHGTQMGRWRVANMADVYSEYTMGYYYDVKKKKWISFENVERGANRRWAYDAKEEAIERLYKNVRAKYIINKRNSEGLYVQKKDG